VGSGVPAALFYVPIAAPRGAVGLPAVTAGATRPYRVHYREPSFVNLQAIPAMAEGGLLADVIVGGASLDPVMGGCDR
jgi:NADH-quinone oxidoreductase subunit D